VGLIEAFDEVLDLRQHLLIPHGLGRLVDVHHHGPLEVGHCAGDGVETVIVGERTAVVTRGGCRTRVGHLRLRQEYDRSCPTAVIAQTNTPDLCGQKADLQGRRLWFAC
jgi:hypothetical protein